MTLALERKSADLPAEVKDDLGAVPICFDIFDTLLTRASRKT